MDHRHILLSLLALLGISCTGSSRREGAGAAPDSARQTGEVFRDCPDCPEMVVIPSGDFEMGAPPDEPGRWEAEGPQRRVHITRFAAGRYHVTRGQWSAFVTATNRATTGGCAWSGLPTSRGDQPDSAASWRNFGYPQDDSHPVACLTFGDAQDYAAWIRQRTGRPYRLLTEAEYEYAARAGSTTAFPWASGVTHERANYGADQCCSPLAAGRDQWVNSSPVGAFPPNAYGLHDMHGNTMQWVQDCFSPTYAGLPVDGSPYEEVKTLQLSGDLAVLNGTTTCDYRILRGGDWNNPPEMIRSAARNFGPPPGGKLRDYKSGGTGFRLARDMEGRAR